MITTKLGLILPILYIIGTHAWGATGLVADKCVSLNVSSCQPSREVWPYTDEIDPIQADDTDWSVICNPYLQVQGIGYCLGNTQGVGTFIPDGHAQTAWRALPCTWCACKVLSPIMSSGWVEVFGDNGQMGCGEQCARYADIVLATLLGEYPNSFYTENNQTHIDCPIPNIKINSDDFAVVDQDASCPTGYTKIRGNHPGYGTVPICPAMDYSCYIHTYDDTTGEFVNQLDC